MFGSNLCFSFQSKECLVFTQAPGSIRPEMFCQKHHKTTGFSSSATAVVVSAESSSMKCSLLYVFSTPVLVFSVQMRFWETERPKKS